MTDRYERLCRELVSGEREPEPVVPEDSFLAERPLTAAVRDA